MGVPPAWTAFKQAFSAYNVNVGKGGIVTNTVYVVGNPNVGLCGLTDGNKISWSWAFYWFNMQNAQYALKITTPNPTQAQLDQLAAAIGQGIGNNAAHEVGHELVNWFNQRKPPVIVNRMDMDDNSQGTYNSENCSGTNATWVYTGFYNGNPIQWSPNANQSLINIYGKKQ